MSKINKSEFFKTELGNKTLACIRGLETHLQAFNSKGFLGYISTLADSDLWLSNATEFYEKWLKCQSAIEKNYEVKCHILTQGNNIVVYYEGNGNDCLIGKFY